MANPAFLRSVLGCHRTPYRAPGERKTWRQADRRVPDAPQDDYGSRRVSQDRLGLRAAGLVHAADFDACESASVLSFGSAQLSVRLLQGEFQRREPRCLFSTWNRQLFEFPQSVIYARGGGNQQPGRGGGNQIPGTGAAKPGFKATKKTPKKAAKKAAKKKPPRRLLQKRNDSLSFRSRLGFTDSQATENVAFVSAVTDLTEKRVGAALHCGVMLNEKQFRERAARELREVGNQVQAMATDRELYRRFDAESQSNSGLAGNGSSFPELLRGAYVDATTMRLRRLLAPEASLSVRRVIVQLADYPDLLHQKVNSRELAEDAAELDKMAAYLKEQIEPHFLPRERTPGALAPTLRELDRALDLVSGLLKKYYWVVCEGYLDLEAKPSGKSAASREGVERQESPPTDQC